ncbi:MAG: hypothetical protein ACRDBM_09965 [Sporomusa sp.]
MLDRQIAGLPYPCHPHRGGCRRSDRGSASGFSGITYYSAEDSQRQPLAATSLAEGSLSQAIVIGFGV